MRCHPRWAMCGHEVLTAAGRAHRFVCRCRLAYSIEWMNLCRAAAASDGWWAGGQVSPAPSGLSNQVLEVLTLQTVFDSCLPHAFPGLGLHFLEQRNVCRPRAAARRAPAALGGSEPGRAARPRGQRCAEHAARVILRGVCAVIVCWRTCAAGYLACTGSTSSSPIWRFAAP